MLQSLGVQEQSVQREFRHFTGQQIADRRWLIQRNLRASFFSSVPSVLNLCICGWPSLSFDLVLILYLRVPLDKNEGLVKRHSDKGVTAFLGNFCILTIPL